MGRNRPSPPPVLHPPRSSACLRERLKYVNIWLQQRIPRQITDGEECRHLGATRCGKGAAVQREMRLDMMTAQGAQHRGD